MTVIVTHHNRFDIPELKDPGFQKKKKKKKLVTGINGYHGIFKIVGWVSEKVFHLTVRYKVGDKVVFFNCRSFEKWYRRINEKSVDTIKSHDRDWIKNAIASLIAQKKEINKEQLAIPKETSNENLEISEKEEPKNDIADGKDNDLGIPENSIEPKKEISKKPLDKNQDQEIKESVKEAGLEIKEPETNLNPLDIIIENPEEENLAKEKKIGYF